MEVMIQHTGNPEIGMMLMFTCCPVSSGHCIATLLSIYRIPLACFNADGDISHKCKIPGVIVRQ